jgi:hypothetical protein
MVDFARMLSIEDLRWTALAGGYKALFDPRPLLARLATEQDTSKTWKELWEELHHQGDVGEASYAAVPFIVEIHRMRGVVNWNTYAIVAIIELARTAGDNPEVPKWFEQDYFHAVLELAGIGTCEILKSEDMDTSRAILSVLAIARNLRNHGKLLMDYSEDDLSNIDPLV